MSKNARGGVGGKEEVIKVLITLHEGFHILDFTGPLSVLNAARHNPKDPSTEAFDVTFVAASQNVMSAQGVMVQAHIDFKEAHERIEEFDVLLVPGGGTDNVIKNNSEPIPFIEAFVEKQQTNPSRERTLISICTGSLFLAKAGVLQGLAATTHPDYDIQLEKLCQSASALISSERTDVMTARYVVNNARFDLSITEDPEDSEAEEKPNPFVLSKAEFLALQNPPEPGKTRRRSSARKGSFSFKESNMRRESFARRSHMRLGGLRVITSGGVTSGLDAALYLVSALVDVESAEEVARGLQYTWIKGVVVNSIDV